MKKLEEDTSKFEQELKDEKIKNKQLEEQISSLRKEIDWQYNLREEKEYNLNSLKDFVRNTMKSLLEDVLKDLNNNIFFYSNLRLISHSLSTNFLGLLDVISAQTEMIQSDLNYHSNKIEEMMKQLQNEVFQKSENLLRGNQKLIERINWIICNQISSDKFDLKHELESTQNFKEGFSLSKTQSFREELSFSRTFDSKSNETGQLAGFSSREKLSQAINDQKIQTDVMKRNLTIEGEEKEVKCQKQLEKISKMELSELVEEIEFNQENPQNIINELKKQNKNYEVKE